MYIPRVYLRRRDTSQVCTLGGGIPLRCVTSAQSGVCTSVCAEWCVYVRLRREGCTMLGTVCAEKWTMLGTVCAERCTTFGTMRRREVYNVRDHAAQRGGPCSGPSAQRGVPCSGPSAQRGVPGREQGRVGTHHTTRVGREDIQHSLPYRTTRSWVHLSMPQCLPGSCGLG